LSLSRNMISGQYYGTNDADAKLSSFSLTRSVMNNDEIPSLKDYQRVAEWYTEITNTTMDMVFDEDTLQPIGFKPKTALPFDKINMKLKRPRANQCEEYIKLIDRYIEERKR